MKVKKIPLRMCIGCKEMKPKKELLRIVKTPDGAVVPDRTGKAAGRGAYICKNPACLAACEKTRALNRAFEMNITPETLALIGEEIGAE